MRSSIFIEHINRQRTVNIYHTNFTKGKLQRDSAIMHTNEIHKLKQNNFN